jgi:hypothetical protein
VLLSGGDAGWVARRRFDRRPGFPPALDHLGLAGSLHRSRPVWRAPNDRLCDMLGVLHSHGHPADVFFQRIIAFLPDHDVAVAVFMDGCRTIGSQHDVRIFSAPIVPAAAHGDPASGGIVRSLSTPVCGAPGDSESVAWDASGTANAL